MASPETHTEYRARHALPPAPSASTSTERCGRAHGAAGYAPRHASDAYLSGYRAGCETLHNALDAREYPPVPSLPDPPDGGDYLFCCEWVAIPGPGETTACSYCGSTLYRSLPDPAVYPRAPLCEGCDNAYPLPDGYLCRTCAAILSAEVPPCECEACNESTHGIDHRDPANIPPVFGPETETYSPPPCPCVDPECPLL